jgi:hypothetical protein
MIFAIFITVSYLLISLWNETKQTFNKYDQDDYSDL